MYSSSSRRTISLFFALLSIATAGIQSTGAVCLSGEVGLGIVIEGFNVLGSRATRAVIIDDTCAIIDGKGTDDTSICGTYGGGSTVTCADGTTPSDVETSDGKEYVDCTPSTEVCSNASNGSLNGNVTVEFCCLRQFPP